MSDFLKKAREAQKKSGGVQTLPQGAQTSRSHWRRCRLGERLRDQLGERNAVTCKTQKKSSHRINEGLDDPTKM